MVNDAFCRFFNRKVDDINRKNWFWPLFPVKLAEDYIRKDKEVCAQRKAIRFMEVEENRLGNDIQKPIRPPVINEQGEVIGIAVLQGIITEQKIAEEALLKSEEKFKGL